MENGEELTEFLEARLGEDEHNAETRDWAAICMDPVAGKARALREVEAKRAILGLHHPTRPHPEFGFTYPAAAKFCGYDGPGDDWQAEREPEWFPDALWPCLTVRLLAAIYSDHPGYRQEWAVTAAAEPPAPQG